MKNTWKIPAGYPKIEVSDDGIVRSFSGKILSQRTMPNGYKTVCVQKGGVGRWVPTLVHRLVCLAFKGEPKPGETETRHLNGIRSDNRAANLLWGTAKENGADRIIHGRIPRNENGTMAKLKNAEVVEIRRLRDSGVVLSEIGRRFNVTASNIYHVCKRNTFKEI